MGVGKYAKFPANFKILRHLRFSVFDASAKLPSGILNGNINQYGDFDQCLSVNAKDFLGQYCLTSIQLSLPKNEKYLNILRKLVMSHEPYESEFDDVNLADDVENLFLLNFVSLIIM